MAHNEGVLIPKKALMSVTNKELIKDLSIELNKMGVEIYCTRGTASYLKEHCITAKAIEEYTGFPEILDGRVKTLHPKIFGGILAKKDQPDHLEQLKQHQIVPFDLVCVDLYPVLKVITEGADLKKVIETTDIGGISLIRASAKAFNYVAVVVEPTDYVNVLNELKKTGGISYETRKTLAANAFKHSANYDTAIYNYLSSNAMPLRYGENPHQTASYFSVPGQKSFIQKAIKGEISYNNILDLDGAVELCFGLKHIGYKHVAVIVKHGSPCGIGVSSVSNTDAFLKAWDCDPLSSYGGVLALSSEPEMDLLEALKGKFVEVLAAPKYSTEFLTRAEDRKKLKIAQLNESAVLDQNKLCRAAAGGMLRQDRDTWWKDLEGNNFKDNFKIVSKKAPTEDEYSAMKLAWATAAATKSNAVIFASKDEILGIGGGCVSRIDATNMALEKAKGRLNAKKDKPIVVMASDGFFPFADSIESALKLGLSAVIEPGGSIRDEDVIASCDKNAVALVFTGKRHFRH